MKTQLRYDGTRQPENPSSGLKGSPKSLQRIGERKDKISMASPSTVTLQWTDSTAYGAAFKSAIGKTSWDPSGFGFGVRVNKTGPVWIYRFDVDGKTTSGTLGEVGLETRGKALTFKDAAAKFDKEWKKAHGSAAGGITLEEAVEHYIERRVSRRTERNLAEETVRGLRSHLRNDLSEAADWVLAATDGLQWDGVLAKVKARSVHGARRCFWLLHGVYEYFGPTGFKVLDENPLDNDELRLAYSPSSLKKKKRTKRVETLDLPKFWEALYALKWKTAQEAIRIFQLSGWRRSAVLRMRWEQIDWKQRCYWVRPGDRGWKGYVGPIALNDFVIQVLEERRGRLANERPRTGALGERQRTRAAAAAEWVFPAYRGSEGPMREVRGSFRTVSKALPYDVQAHDCRRGFASVGRTVLGSGWMLGRLMAHQELAGLDDEAGSRQTDDYVDKYLPAERIASNKVAGAIMEIAMGDISDALQAKFLDKGIDLRRGAPLDLLDLEDDDIDAKEAEAGKALAAA